MSHRLEEMRTEFCNRTPFDTGTFDECCRLAFGVAAVTTMSGEETLAHVLAWVETVGRIHVKCQRGGLDTNAVLAEMLGVLEHGPKPDAQPLEARIEEVRTVLEMAIDGARKQIDDLYGITGTTAQDLAKMGARVETLRIHDEAHRGRVDTLDAELGRCGCDEDEGGEECQEEGPPYDAATATGMYDLNEG